MIPKYLLTLSCVVCAGVAWIPDVLQESPAARTAREEPALRVPLPLHPSAVPHSESCRGLLRRLSHG